MSDCVALTAVCPLCGGETDFYDLGHIKKDFIPNGYQWIVKEYFDSYRFGWLGTVRRFKYIHPDHVCPRTDAKRLEDFT